MPALECDTGEIETGDELRIDLADGVVENLTKGTKVQATTLPTPFLRLIADGGLIEHLSKNGDFAVG